MVELSSKRRPTLGNGPVASSHEPFRDKIHAFLKSFGSRLPQRFGSRTIPKPFLDRKASTSTRPGLLCLLMGGLRLVLASTASLSEHPACAYLEDKKSSLLQSIDYLLCKPWGDVH